MDSQGTIIKNKSKREKDEEGDESDEDND